MSAVRILGKASSINVRKVLWACRELGIAYEREDWGAGFRATDTPEYLRLNPNALVPVLIDGDFVLWESNAIVRYLAMTHGDGTLLPADPKARAIVEQWMDWQASEFNNSWRYAFMALVRQSADHSDPHHVAASIGSWNRNIQIVDDRLRTTGGYIAGPEFTVADIPIGLSINRWLMTPIEPRPRHPSLDAYVERLKLRPAFLEHGSNGIP